MTFTTEEIQELIEKIYRLNKASAIMANGAVIPQGYESDFKTVTRLAIILEGIIEKNEGTIPDSAQDLATTVHTLAALIPVVSAKPNTPSSERATDEQDELPDPEAKQ